MSKPKRSDSVEPIEFETFIPPDSWALRELRQHEPSCFNGIVRVRKYRVTVTPIEESTDVLRERLEKMWVKSDNSHHYQPLMDAAKSLGISLDNHKFGSQRKGTTR